MADHWPTWWRASVSISCAAPARAKARARFCNCTAIIAHGAIVGIMPDGPRGPAYQLSPGIVFLAQKSGAPVVPMNMEFSQLLAFEELGSLHSPEAVFQGACHSSAPLHRVAADRERRGI